MSKTYSTVVPPPIASGVPKFHTRLRRRSCVASVRLESRNLNRRDGIMMETRQVVVCAFYDAESARDAMNDLREAGFTGEDISLLSPDRTGQGKTPDGKRERAR